MLTAILIITVTVVLVFVGAYGAMVVYIFDEERYEHEKESDTSGALQGEELQRDNP